MNLKKSIIFSVILKVIATQYENNKYIFDER